MTTTSIIGNADQRVQSLNSALFRAGAKYVLYWAQVNRRVQWNHGLAYAADLNRLYAGLGTGGFCNVFDGKDYKLVGTIKYADDADNVRYDAARHLVFVAHAEKALGVVDAKTYAVKADMKLPGGAEGFQIMKLSKSFPGMDMHAIAEAWRSGSVVRSRLAHML